MHTHDGVSLRTAVLQFLSAVRDDLEDFPADDRSYHRSEYQQTVDNVMACIRNDNWTGALYQSTNLVSFYEDDDQDGAPNVWKAWTRLDEVLSGLMSQEVQT